MVEALKDHKNYSREKSRRWRERNREKFLAAERARRPYKREWEAGECPECGDHFASAKGKRSKACNQCRRKTQQQEYRERVLRCIALREEGLLNNEIAERENTSQAAIAVLLHRAKRDDFKVPPSPYFKGPK